MLAVAMASPRSNGKCAVPLLRCGCCYGCGCRRRRRALLVLMSYVDVLTAVPGGADGPGGVLVLAENWIIYRRPVR